MEASPQPLPASTICHREPQIDPSPAYQRGAVWSIPQKQLFIDSMLRGFDVPKFYLNRIDNGQFKWEILDGQQRLRSIWRFRKDEFALDAEVGPE